MSDVHKGLEGVLVAESSLSSIDGDAGELRYRGYDIQTLASNASYEEIVYLLWHGSLPDETTLDEFTTVLTAEREVPRAVIDTLRSMAEQDAPPMAAVRTGVSMVSAGTESISSRDRAETIRAGRRIVASLPTVVAAYARLREGKEPISPRDDLGYAANFLYMLNGEKPNEVSTEVFDQALVLHADHGLNASTYSARVTASTLSDVYSAVTSAIGTLAGPLHGGANEAVMKMLQEVDRSSKNPDQWLDDALEAGERIMGFGHRVYNVKDPRAEILETRSKELAESMGDRTWYELSKAIEEYMTEEKSIAPNVDFYSASMYYQMGIPLRFYTPIFAMSRTSGWVAHVIEQYEDNRLIRPRARYVGPEEAEFLPLEER